MLEVVNLFRCYVEFAGAGGSVAGIGEHDRQGLDIGEADEMIVAVLMAVLAGGVVVQSCQYR